MSPLEAVKAHCRWCCNDQHPRELCVSEKCPLFLFRTGRAVAGISRLKAIRARCKDCAGGSLVDVRTCTVLCPLRPFRMGTNENYGAELRAGRSARARARREKTRQYGPISETKCTEGS